MGGLDGLDKGGWKAGERQGRVVSEGKATSIDLLEGNKKMEREREREVFHSTPLLAPGGVLGSEYVHTK